MTTSTILPTLTGGLGNRIFQVLAAFGYAEKKGGTVYFYEGIWRENPHDIPQNIYTLFPTIPRLPNTFLLHNQAILTESMWPPPTFVKEIVVLRGWFQDEKWFPKQMPPITLPLVEEYIDYPFLHIRRGDYLTLLHHYVPLEHYYRTALSFFPEDQTIVVFSDDMDWCKRELTRLYPSRQWIWAPEENDVDTLARMASCRKGAICANSSFSWLGAFLGAHTYGNPCYFPSQWFGDNRPTSIYPSWGTIVSVDP